MNIHFGRMVLLVHDYDEALDFYTKNFGCRVLFDQDSSFGLRYLHVGFGNDDKAGIWLLKAEGKEQQAQVGRQTLEQPALVLYTDDLQALYQRLLQNKVVIKTPPASNPEYAFLHCRDLYGNELIIAELKQ